VSKESRSVGSVCERISILIVAAAISLVAPIESSCAQSAPADEASFLAENAAAMDKMMTGMTVKPTGNVDGDFAEMMIPHHQGAIDMALAELRYGKNEQLRRIAQEIVVEQQQEIIAMRLALGQPLPPSAPSQTQAAPGQAAPGHASTPESSAMSHGAMSMPPAIKK
jgi:hypothetical protein